MAVPTRRRTTELPFKGESFPEYVVQRLHRDRPPIARAPAELSGSQKRSPPGLEIDQSPARCVVAPPSTAAATLKAPSAQPSQAASISQRPGQRPSLTDQLKAISQGAEDVTVRLKTTYKLGNTGNSGSTLVVRSQTTSGAGSFQATTVGMTVGRLDCRFPCPATFANDHCAYLFQHPFETKEIQMVMYYRDMVDTSVSTREKCFRFRIDHALHQFGDDYNPANPQHWIKIMLASVADVERVRQHLALRRRSIVAGKW